MTSASQTAGFQASRKQRQCSTRALVNVGLCPYHKGKTGTDWLSSSTAHAFLQPLPLSLPTLFCKQAQGSYTPQVIHRKTFLRDHVPAAKGCLITQQQSKLAMSCLGREQPFPPPPPGTSSQPGVVTPRAAGWAGCNAPAGPAARAMGQLSSRWQTLPTSRPCSGASSSPRQPPLRNRSPRLGSAPLLEIQLETTLSFAFEFLGKRRQLLRL